MKRLPDWRIRLQAYVTATAQDRFQPGETDCALFAAGAVEAMTGTDPAQAFRGHYTSLKGGFKRLKTAGFADLAAYACAHFTEVPVARAQVGDIAVLEGNGEAALGIVQGERIYIRSPQGLATVSLLKAERMFRL